MIGTVELRVVGGVIVAMAGSLIRSKPQPAPKPPAPPRDAAA